MQVDLQGKVALVTGAGRGIGRAIADRFAANGAQVIYSDIEEDAANEAAAHSPQGMALRLDVSDPDQVQQGVEAVLKRWGHLDILVNNAGINTLHHRVNIDRFPLEEWERIVRVDLTGLFLMSQAAAIPMLAQRSGRIINIASVVGLVPLRLQSAFVAAKGGVVNLTRSMALELGHQGVLVNGIAPGSILTEGTRQLFYGEDGSFRDFAAALLAHIPLGRPGTVDEVAHAALFLAAPESSYINGHILTVDGGWTAGYLRRRRPSGAGGKGHVHLPTALVRTRHREHRHGDAGRSDRDIATQSLISLSSWIEASSSVHDRRGDGRPLSRSSDCPSAP